MPVDGFLGGRTQGPGRWEMAKGLLWWLQAPGLAV